MFVGLHPRGDVAQDRDVEVLAVDRDHRDRCVDRELLAVAAQPGDRAHAGARAAHRPRPPAALAEVADVVVVRAAVLVGQQAVEPLAEHLVGAVAEHARGRRVEQHDGERLVDRHDGVHRRLDQPGQTGLALAQLRLAAQALADLHLQLRHVALHALVEAAVFVDAPGLRGVRDEQCFIVGTEASRAELVDHQQPAVDMFERGHRHDQAALHRRQAATGLDQAGALVSRHLEALRPARVEHLGGQRHIERHLQREQGLRGLQAPAAAVEQAGVVGVLDAQHRRARAQQLARTTAELVEQGVRIVFGGQQQAQFGQRRQPLVGSLELAHLGQQLVADHAQVDLAERAGSGLRGRGRAPRCGVDGMHQRLGHRVQDDLRLGRLGQHRLHAAGLRQVAGLALQVGGGPEDHLGLRDLGLATQPAHELVAVHRGHQDVADDEVGPLGQRGGEAFDAVAGLEDLVPGVTQQGHDQAAVVGFVVDDEDTCHGLRSPPQCAGGTPPGRKASTWATKVSGSIGLVR